MHVCCNYELCDLIVIVVIAEFVFLFENYVRLVTTFWLRIFVWRERACRTWLVRWTAVVCTTSALRCVAPTNDPCYSSSL